VSSRSALVIANAALKLLRGDEYTLPKERKVADIAPARLERLVGKYVNARTPGGIHGPPVVTFRLEDGKLVLNYGPGRDVYFETISETTFYSNLMHLELTFEEKDTGQIKAMRLKGESFDMLANRVEK